MFLRSAYYTIYSIGILPDCIMVLEAVKVKHPTPALYAPVFPLTQISVDQSIMKSQRATNEQARFLLDEYIHFYNYERIQLKN